VRKLSEEKGRKVCVVYFSFTGKSKAVAEEIGRRLKAKIMGVEPRVMLPYLGWLLLSFIPELKFPIRNLEIPCNFLVLCFPKWTLNCPPITSLIKAGKLREKRVFVVIVYGGWDEKRYAKYYIKKIEKFGGRIAGVKLVKRKKIQEVIKNDEFFREIEIALSIDPTKSSV